MSRYRNTNTKVNKKGKIAYKPTMIPKIPIRDSDIFILPKFGDRLDSLAFKHYGDSSLWWIIAKANNLDAAHIGLEVGKQIRIPVEVDIIINQLKDTSY